jgi:hypothetical protein
VTNYSLPGWRENLLQTNLPNQEERDLLSRGPSSLAKAFQLQAIKYKYVIHGIEEP